jgi:hypothetical protein
MTEADDEHFSEPIACPLDQAEPPWIVIPEAGAYQHHDWQTQPDPDSKTQDASQTMSRQQSHEKREDVRNVDLTNKLH